MSKHQSDSKASKKSKTDMEWENRVLCSDGNCIGVVGPDGNCKECGKPYEGKLPWQTQTAQPEPGPEASDHSSAQSQAAETVADAAEDTEEEIRDDDDWANRKLCSDGNCIGVIGPDGRCKECGKPHEGD